LPANYSGFPGDEVRIFRIQFVTNKVQDITRIRSRNVFLERKVLENRSVMESMEDDRLVAKRVHLVGFAEF
jgi:hypothetical protein